MTNAYSTTSQFGATLLIMLIVAGLCLALDSLRVPAGGILLVLQLATGIIALLFNRLLALTAALVGALCFNYLFTSPRHSLQMHQAEDIINLIVFCVIALLGSQFARYYRAQQGALRKAQVQNGLLMSVSHDLRTPLSTIIGSMETMQKYGDKLDETARTELLDGALKEGNRLHRYIENLLQASRLHHHGILEKTDTVNLHQLLEDLLLRLNSARLRLITRQPDYTLKCASQLLQQALYNVIDNALRYSPAATPVIIRYGLTNNHYTLTIRDYGKGLNEQQARQAFELFHSSREGDSGDGGIGLGLTVAKAIIDAHSGTIVLDPKEPGCEVTITLPGQQQESVR
ncbi:sensor histidine kinase [Salinimonas lutimaris]|uniref:sensor histidine kinase n=1 Tax=Salinimonas lutimaris TaxID=914153 RepID=UPI001585DB56|nr:DUF4118 domain-containing protein [Salinimonas lutimaris]